MELCRTSSALPPRSERALTAGPGRDAAAARAATGDHLPPPPAAHQYGSILVFLSHMLLFISGPQTSGTQLQLKCISQPSLSGESCSDSTLVSQVVKLDREVSLKTINDSQTNMYIPLLCLAYVILKWILRSQTVDC